MSSRGPSLKLDLASGDIAADLRREGEAILKMIGEHAGAHAAAFKATARGEVRRAFRPTSRANRKIGQNVEKTIGGRAFRNRDGSTVGFAWWSFKWGRVFRKGATIRGRKFLAIPLPAAEKLGLARADEARGEFGRFSSGSGVRRARVGLVAARFGTPHLIRLKGGNFMLAIDRDAARSAGVRKGRSFKLGRGRAAQRLTPLFLFLRQVTIKPKLDFLALARAEHERFNAAVVRDFVGTGLPTA